MTTTNDTEATLDRNTLRIAQSITEARQAGHGLSEQLRQALLLLNGGGDPIDALREARGHLDRVRRAIDEADAAARRRRS